MKIALLGYGKMGKTIERLAIKRGHTIVCTVSSSTQSGMLEDADVAIEFSAPDTAVQNIVSCFDHKVPVVSGTTGWLQHYNEVLNKCEKSNGTFIYASNFSIGVHLFFNLNEYLAKLMSSWKDYKVAIEEIHHIQKKDAPSGTAISIAEGILPYSPKKNWVLGNDVNESLSISAKRLEDVKGTHKVTYSSKIDTISIQHEAHSRDGFAIGAIMAAEWLLGKKGVFSMKDVLELN